jgi:hypothetical protein
MIQAENTPGIGEVKDLSNITGQTPMANNFVATPNLNNNKKKKNNGQQQEQQQSSNGLYTNDDLIKFLKLNKLMNKVEQSPQQQQQPVQQQPIQPVIMMPPMGQPFFGQSMPLPQQVNQSNLTYIDREEIRGMINRYSEDTEKILKDYIKDNNDKLITYVKELFAYKQNMDTILKKVENKETDNKLAEEAAKKDSASPIINAVNAIPRQLGNVFNSIKGAVSTAVNTTSNKLTGSNQTPATPATTPTPANNSSGIENTSDENMIDNKLKTPSPGNNQTPSTPTTPETPATPTTPTTPPVFQQPDEDALKNARAKIDEDNKKKLASQEVNRLKNDLSNVGLGVQSGGGRKKNKITHKKRRKNQKQKISRLREKK